MNNVAVNRCRTWLSEVLRGWDEFWFTATRPHTFCLIRILAGMMLLYTHLVWTIDLMAFIGPDAWLTIDLSREIASRQNPSAWTPLWHIQSPALLWGFHITGLLVIFMFTIGLFTRVTAVASWMFAVAYCQRLQGALFGLDQVNTMLTLYLMLGPCGAVYSVDHWLRRSKSGINAEDDSSSVWTNVGIRLIQVHMCVIYFFGGISKMTGGDWRNGNAIWFAIANQEYQSLDITWLGSPQWAFLLAVLTHVTVFWEISYSALIWHRLTRPVMLAIALLIHGGIALFMGMITFGVAMIFGNLAFIKPATVEAVIGKLTPNSRSDEADNV